MTGKRRRDELDGNRFTTFPKQIFTPPRPPNQVPFSPRPAPNDKSLPPIAERDSTRHENLPPHYDSSDKFQVLCYVQLGGKGFGYLVAENDHHQACLVHPMAGTTLATLQAQRQAVAMVQHPSFAEVYCTFTHKVNGQDHHFAVREAMKLSLKEVAASPLLTDVRLVSFLRPVIECLVYIHSIGSMHGDIRCSNVLLDYGGNVKIIGQEQLRNISDEGIQAQEDMKGFQRLVYEFVEGGDFSEVRRSAEGPGGTFRLPHATAKLSAVGLDLIETILRQTDTLMDAHKILQHPLFAQTQGSRDALRGMLHYHHYHIGFVTDRTSNWWEKVIRERSRLHSHVST